MNSLRMWMLMLLMAGVLLAQGSFDIEDYAQFLADHENMRADQLIQQHAPAQSYFTGHYQPAELSRYAFGDSIQKIYGLTDGEMSLLQNHRFVVSERLSRLDFTRAFHDIYSNDLPVFITTDAVLHALHVSYDDILMDVEVSMLEPRLIRILDEMAVTFQKLEQKYGDIDALKAPLADVDLFIAVAQSLLQDKEIVPRLASGDHYRRIMSAIEDEGMAKVSLFSERDRRIDFSQFIVRGHYNQIIYTPEGERTLANYFKTMMWLGRIEIWFTAPPKNPWEDPWTPEEIKRMVLGGVLLNEWIDVAGVRPDLNEIDRILTFMVGESDNLTPTELLTLQEEQGIESVSELVDENTYNMFHDAVKRSAVSEQQILSNLIMMDPYSTSPDTLPVSFRMLGQRFIIDSYVFSNVVYDRILFEGKKVWRPMPDPLDALFVLGNDNALPLLRDELERYHYASQLASLRYLVESYDADFWQQSLYNAWLQSIRQLNPHPTIAVVERPLPFFMRTVAWQQQKINTQLASWAQLRHDNLLYAKQSYTGMTGCSFPHSYVEPYPDFYRAIAEFARRARLYFDQLTVEVPVWPDMPSIPDYFARLEEVTLHLARLAEKECRGESFSDDEQSWLKEMLFVGGGSGRPPYTGWYADLYYDTYKAGEPDFVIADVHTQPTEFDGSVVGKVLHVGVGKVNLGIFLVETPSSSEKPVAFVGPTFSYYEKITRDFDRMTDERWTDDVEADRVPVRPNWVNVYLADRDGNRLRAGRELPGELYSGLDTGPSTQLPTRFGMEQNSPNPFNPETRISYSLPESGAVSLVVYDVLGRRVEVLVDHIQQAGRHTVHWQAQGMPSGLYFARLRTGGQQDMIQMILMK